MFVPTRAMTWVLALVTLGLVIVALLAMTGEILDRTILGNYTGYHALAVLATVTGVLALVAALLRGTRV